MQVFTGTRKPPVYSIIQIEMPKTRKDLREINEKLDELGAKAHLYFTKAGDVDPREGFPAVGTVVLSKTTGYSRYSDVLKYRCLVVSADGNVSQAQNLGEFNLFP